jgi:hypothetical protein
MAYENKPSFIKKGSLMYEAFQTLSKDSFANLSEFDNKMKKDALYPAMKHGFLRIYKNGLVRLNASGKMLFKSAK